MTLPELTSDEPAPGLRVWQPRQGFRYGSEAFWLAGFALEPGLPTDAVDLGTGSGVIAMLLARRGVNVLGIDVWSGWKSCWTRTLSDSRTLGPVRLVNRDVMAGPLGPVDLVVSNPPFFPDGSGPSPANPQRAVARFESTASVAKFVGVGLASLRPNGRMCLVVPVHREPHVVAAADVHAATIRRWVRVGSRRSLMELVSGGKSSTCPEHIEPRGTRTCEWYASMTLGRPSVASCSDAE